MDRSRCHRQLQPPDDIAHGAPASTKGPDAADPVLGGRALCSLNRSQRLWGPCRYRMV